VSHARSPRLAHLGVTQPAPDQPEVGAPITARMPQVGGWWRLRHRDPHVSGDGDQTRGKGWEV
jgi:hypothetical protein